MMERGKINHVFIKCSLASKDVHETETVLCKQKTKSTQCLRIKSDHYTNSGKSNHSLLQQLYTDKVMVRHAVVKCTFLVFLFD